MNFSEHLTPANVMVCLVLAIQIYKLARPFLAKTERGAAVVSAVDNSWAFIYDKAPLLYGIVEALAEKGIISKGDKANRFLEELRGEALKHQISLQPQHEAEAKFIARSLAAKDHQPGTVVGELVGTLPITGGTSSGTFVTTAAPLPPNGDPTWALRDPK